MLLQGDGRARPLPDQRLIEQLHPRVSLHDRKGVRRRGAVARHQEGAQQPKLDRWKELYTESRPPLSKERVVEAVISSVIARIPSTGISLPQRVGPQRGVGSCWATVAMGVPQGIP